VRSRDGRAGHLGGGRFGHVTLDAAVCELALDDRRHGLVGGHDLGLDEVARRRALRPRLGSEGEALRPVLHDDVAPRLGLGRRVRFCVRLFNVLRLFDE
jgi:hypothetical protein